MKMSVYASVHMQLTGDFKLPTGVNIRVNGYLCPCVSPATDWQHVQGLPHLSLN